MDGLFPHWFEMSIYMSVSKKAPKNSCQNLLLSVYLHDKRYIVFYRDEEQTQEVHFH